MVCGFGLSIILSLMPHNKQPLPPLLSNRSSQYTRCPEYSIINPKSLNPVLLLQAEVPLHQDPSKQRPIVGNSGSEKGPRISLEESCFLTQSKRQGLEFCFGAPVIPQLNAGDPSGSFPLGKRIWGGGCFLELLFPEPLTH